MVFACVVDEYTFAFTLGSSGSEIFITFKLTPWYTKVKFYFTKLLFSADEADDITLVFFYFMVKLSIKAAE